MKDNANLGKKEQAGKIGKQVLTDHIYLTLWKGGKLWLFEIRIMSSWDLLSIEVQGSLAINIPIFLQTLLN